MKATINALTVALVLAIAGCASVKVDRIDSVHLANYKKYAWVKPEENTSQLPAMSASITEDNIRSAVKSEFVKKGITEDEQNPDLLLMYHIFTTRKTENVPNAPVYPYYGYGFGPRTFFYHGRLIPIAYGGYYNPWNTGYHQEHYTEGTLMIDVIDARTNELLWRGSVENPVNDAASLSKQFAKEAKQILGKYPDIK